jgi:hypothetical protein
MLPNYQQLPNVRQNWKRSAEVLISRMDDDVESDKVERSQNNGRQVLRLTCKQLVIFTVHSQLVEF